ncbi:cellulose binding domain-containing protein [Xanthomonas sp. GPE 39]|uniref:GH12 family glycosyl hydrolase domain-containing protein n=1 Tax=Xanthomonas sp. GPE 39 TaxID=1583099 RepID=UPI000A8E8610|nr:cellulose binding domain-containing protein [Xanthomonas sp. GPE 39]
MHNIKMVAGVPRKTRRPLQTLLALACMAAAPLVMAGPNKVYGSHYAWVNDFGDPNHGMQGTFGTGTTPELNVSFNYPSNDLHGYPAILRGYHYGWNPANDNLFPAQVSSLTSIPVQFSYSAGGTDMHGDFAYDIFFRRDANKDVPQLELMIWGGNNSYPVGQPTATNVITAGGYTFDLWEGDNAGAGYYVYTFIPHGTAGQANLPTSGSLNVDVKQFLNWLQANRSQDGRYSDSLYLHVVETGFEVVRGKGWIDITANIDAKTGGTSGGGASGGGTSGGGTSGGGTSGGGTSGGGTSGGGTSGGGTSGGGTSGGGTSGGGTSGGGTSGGGTSGGGSTSSPSFSTRTIVDSDWHAGYCEHVQVTNTGTSAGNWSISQPISGTINSLWNAIWTQSGSTLSAAGMDWNKTLAPGAMAEFGFCASR